MTTRIFKYPLGFDDDQVVALHTGFEILCVQVQNDIPTLWAVVDPDMPSRSIRVWMIPTGNYPYRMGKSTYIGTAQLNGGRLVGHFFYQVLDDDD